jgi:organic radical activating enzyme
MRLRDIGPAWSKILRGHKPLLSLEITKECPLRCPGCYAYEESHLGSSGPLRQLNDYKGEALVAAVHALVRRLRPLHVSIVGGEPLVRHKELSVLLPKLANMKVEVQLVTSAVRPIPARWRGIHGLHIVVSIDGLQAEHDARRSPATYERILKNIVGRQVTVHCTITAELRYKFPKVKMPSAVLDGYAHPPTSPKECIFAQTTTCVSADLTTRIAPCQFGGRPVCSECGCMASAGLAAIGRHRLAGLIQVSNIFDVSKRLGEQYAGWASQP